MLHTFMYNLMLNTQIRCSISYSTIVFVKMLGQPPQRFKLVSDGFYWQTFAHVYVTVA